MINYGSIEPRPNVHCEPRIRLKFNRKVPGLTCPTEREIRFLQALADGFEYAHIAYNEGMALASVKNLAKLICDKLGADNKTHAVAMALRRGLIN